MTKQDITQVADFVRGLMEPEAARQMEEYLQGPGASSSTQKEVSALRRVARLAEIDRNLQVPGYAVRCAKALGSVRRQETRESSLLERLTMALTFDSRMAPAFAGTRDLRSSDRQMVFQSQGFQIDLRLETDKKGSVVVGQLIKDGKDVQPVADVPILAMAEEEIIARSKTGELGEFQAEGLSAESIALLFLVDDEKCLEVSLGEIN